MKDSFFDKLKKTEPKYLVQAILYAVLCIVFYYAQYYVTISENYHEIRYFRQLFIILFTVSLLLFFITLKKILPDHIISTTLKKILKILKVQEIFQAVTGKFRQIFGLPDRRTLRGGQDRKNFIFSSPFKKRMPRKSASHELQRWKELSSNAERIRYIYIKYMQKKVKSGFHFDGSKTPDEIAYSIKVPEDQTVLFTLYNGARYSGGSYIIENSDVENSIKLVSKNGKIS